MYYFVGSAAIFAILGLSGVNRVLERYAEIVRLYLLPSGEEVKLLMASGTYLSYKLQEVTLKGTKANNSQIVLKCGDKVLFMNIGRATMYSPEHIYALSLEQVKKL